MTKQPSIAYGPVILFCMLAASAVADGAKPSNALDGDWLVEHAQTGNVSNVFLARNSVLAFKACSFTVTHFCGSKNDLHGSFTIGSDSDGAMDLNLDAVDVSDVWTGATYPEGSVPAIFKLERDHLTICFETGVDRHSPTSFAASDIKTHLVTLVRAHPGFHRVPQITTISVQDDAGQPVRDASIFRFMSFSHFGGPTTQPSGWNYAEIGHTSAAGTAVLQYEELNTAMIGAHDEQRHLTGFASASPAALQDGTISVVLKPEILVHGKLECSDIPISWTNVYLFYDGERVAGCTSLNGTFGFNLPAGSYRVNTYGTQLLGRYLDMIVPTGKAEFSPPPISLQASRFTLLKEHPAPELANFHGWAGTPTTLASLRGKYVLLDFWGYWCSPCVAEMPVLVHLHTRFKDKGLAVIGVHVDADIEVDTAAKLDEKLVSIKARLWDGKSLPFPVVLTSPLSAGARDVEHSNTPAGAYGIHEYPTTIVIDRKGNVIGTIDLSDEKAAADQIQKWVDSD